MIFKIVVSGKVQVGNDQGKAQPEKDSLSKNRGGKKPKLLYKLLKISLFIGPKRPRGKS